MRVLLRQAMELAGYGVVEAENGRQGVRQMQDHDINLVVTDLIMPEQEGLETIAKLTREYPAVKIIAISGGGRIEPEAYLPAALELGATEVFSKPFDIRKFVRTVEEILVDA
ncbi:MAG: response regulator [Desulfobulbus propionicus]|nr:MAG: response regulator [Desulfobulbus propionicus]